MYRAICTLSVTEQGCPTTNVAARCTIAPGYLHTGVEGITLHFYAGSDLAFAREHLCRIGTWQPTP